MLIYRHWAIIAPGENLFDIIALEKCEVPTQKANIAILYIKQETPGVIFGAP